MSIYSPPYALVQVSVNGAGPVQGGTLGAGQVIPASATIALTGVNTSGWNTALWEIYDYPPGWTAPSGWSTAATGVVYYNGTSVSPNPPAWTAPSVAGWGKWGIRLTVNNNTDPTGAINYPRMQDTSMALSMYSAHGLRDGLAGEQGQFATILPNGQWTQDYKANVRTFEAEIAAVGSPSQNTVALTNAIVNDNVAVPAGVSSLQFNGYTTSAILGGMAISPAPVPGVPFDVRFVGTAGAPVTIVNASAGSSAGNQILTGTDADMLLPVGGQPSARFVRTLVSGTSYYVLQNTAVDSDQIVYATNFGAASAVADNSAQLQAALTALGASGGGILMLPRGGLSYGTTLTPSPNTTIRGHGSTASVLTYTGTGDAIALKQAVNGSNSAYLYLDKLGVTCSNANNVGACLDNVAGTYVGARKCSFTGGQYGVIFDQTELGVIEDCIFGLQTLAGIWLVNDASHSAGADSGFTNQITIKRNAFEAMAFGIIDDGGSVHTIEGNTFDGVLCSDIVYAAVQAFAVKKNYQEVTYNEPLISNSSTFNTFISSTSLGGSPRTWVPSTTYQYGSLIKPTSPNGYIYECTFPSTATATQPTWPTTIGATVTDAGGSVWKCIVATGSGTGVGFSQAVWICHNIWQSEESCILYINGESVPLEFSCNFLNAPNALANVGGYIANAGGLVQLDARNNYLNNAGCPITTSAGYAQTLMNSYGSIGASQFGIGPGVGGAPLQTLDVGGSVGLQSVTKATSYACDAGVAGGNPPDCVVLCNQSGAISIALPVPSNRRVIVVTDKSGTANTNNVTILPNASETINGASSYVLNLAHASIMLQSDGTNWFVIGSYNGTVI